MGMHITQLHFMTGHKHLIVRPPLRHHCQNLVNRKHYVPKRLHGITLQKAVILIFTRVINSKLCMPAAFLQSSRTLSAEYMAQRSGNSSALQR